ncbi:MAG: hypothetical protein OEY52_07155 [Gammaproteobacteria bacterium]|nr:hypothetical protein [Gammaproteobacteria bacterium]
MKKTTLLIFLILLSASGCTNDSQNKNKITVQFPVTNECREASINKLKEVLGNVKGFEFTYKPFDFKLDSHKEIGGYIELTSTILKSKKEFDGYFNAVLFDCHHTSVMNLNISELSNIIKLKGIQSGYATINNEKATVVFGSRKR